MKDIKVINCKYNFNSYYMLLDLNNHQYNKEVSIHANYGTELPNKVCDCMDHYKQQKTISYSSIKQFK